VVTANYCIGTARKISVDTDATPDRLLLIQQKLHIVQYRYGSLSSVTNLLNSCIVPRQPAPDPQEPCTGSHDDWLACVTAMESPRRPQAIARKMASACRRFVIWRSVFLFFGTRSLV